MEDSIQNFWKEVFRFEGMFTSRQFWDMLFDRPSYVHPIKFNEAGEKEWDRTVGSRPDMYRVVMIDAVGDDGSVVVGERERARSILDYLPG